MQWLAPLVVLLQLVRQSGASYGNCSCFESQPNITNDNGTQVTQQPLMCNCLNRDNSGEASCAVSCKDCLEVKTGNLVDDMQRGTTQRHCDIYKYELDCFPGSAMVLLSNGSEIQMEALEVGDEVAVGGGAFSPVHLFTHRQRDTINRFMAIHAANLPAPVLMTPGHYVYVNGGSLVTARQVKVGDILVSKDRRVHGDSGDGDGSNVATENFTVTKVEMNVESKGLYNPHTLHGDIVVNNVVASTLTDAVHPTLAHALLWPARALYNLGVDLVGDAFDNGAFHAAQPYMLKGAQVYEA